MMENEARENDTIIQVKDLKVNIKTDDGILTAVRGVNFEIKKGETLGLVGESGCGKSLTSKAILGINDKKCSAEGEIIFDADGMGQTDLLKLKPRGDEIRSVRGKQISMIFQEPMVAFSPMYTIGNQINEATLLHITKDKKKAKEISLGVMKKVGIANAEKRYDQYPHEFSGGMLQRALIAMALVCNPKLLIADEPTTRSSPTTWGPWPGCATGWRSCTWAGSWSPPRPWISLKIPSTPIPRGSSAPSIRSAPRARISCSPLRAPCLWH